MNWAGTRYDPIFWVTHNAYERVWAHVPWGKVFNKPALGGKQLSAKFFQGQHYPTTPPIKLRAGSPYPVDREHDD